MATTTTTIGRRLNDDPAAESPKEKKADLGLLSEEAVDIFANVALGTIGAAVGFSAGFKLAGKDFPADPLTLIFLVQGIAMTARISQMPREYREGKQCACVAPQHAVASRP